MSETKPEDEPGQKKPETQEVVQQIRTEEPQAPFGADEPNPNVATDKIAADMSAEAAEPGIGGYGGRDPKSDMPRIPGVEDTQDDPKSHDAKPDEGKARGVHD